MDWTALYADDHYLSDLAAGQPAPDQLGMLLTAWREDVDADPIPLLDGEPAVLGRGCA